MEQKVAVFRKEHFNAAHRLYCADWTTEKNTAVFGPCANPNYHGHNYELVVQVNGVPDSAASKACQQLAKHVSSPHP